MTTFSRHTLLKSAAGLALLGPLVRETWAQSATPMRLVIVLECNGIYPVALLSQAARAALGADAIGSDRNFDQVYPKTALTLTDDALSSALCLDPLAASSGKISLEDRAAVVLGLSSLIAGGGHSSGTGALSCAVDGAAATIGDRCPYRFAPVHMEKPQANAANGANLSSVKVSTAATVPPR